MAKFIRLSFLAYLAILPSLGITDAKFTDSEGHLIDKIVIEGNRHIREYEILRAMSRAPEDNIQTAVNFMKVVRPYFRDVKLRIEREGDRYVAYIIGLFNDCMI
ncbi:hypothetical protein J7M22_14725 [Candidatus Poribacteria bacterium]|nr:hypothetical protein [Candidatus Poribacteria bacterium]